MELLKQRLVQLIVEISRGKKNIEDIFETQKEIEPEPKSNKSIGEKRGCVFKRRGRRSKIELGLQPVAMIRAMQLGPSA